MPIVELDDGRRIETDDTSPEAIDEIAAHLSGGAATSSSTTTTTTSAAVQPPEKAPGLGGAIAESLETAARPIAEAASTVLAAGVSPMERLSKVATIASPLLYPPAIAAKIGAQTVARAAGAPKEEAETFGGAVGAGIGLGGAVAGGVGAVKALRAGRAAGPTAAGEGLQARLPGATEALRRRVQAQHFEPVAKYAEEQGLALQPGSTQANKVADAIEAAHAKWGSTPRGEELLGKLRSGEGPVSYGDLDSALRLLPGRAKEARGAVQAAIDELVAGTPAAAKLKAGRAAWKLDVVPARKLAHKVENAEGPIDALNFLTSATKGPHRKEIAARVLGGEPDQWDKALDALSALKGSDRGHLESLGRYMQHRALYHGLIGGLGGAAVEHDHPFWGGIGGALAGLAVGGAIQHAGTAATFLKGGLSGRPAAQALAKVISEWGSQQEEPQKAAALDVASALRANEGPSTAESALGTTAHTISPQPQLTGTGSSVLPFASEISRVASVVGVDPSLLHSIMQVESGGNPSAVSDGGEAGTSAYGLMQITPDTFNVVRQQVEHLLGRPADIMNPWDSLAASAYLLQNYLTRSGGDIEAAARYYHGGLNTRWHGPRTAAYGRNVAALYHRLKGGSS